MILELPPPSAPAAEDGEVLENRLAEAPSPADLPRTPPHSRRPQQIFSASASRLDRLGDVEPSCSTAPTRRGASGRRPGDSLISRVDARRFARGTETTRTRCE